MSKKKKKSASAAAPVSQNNKRKASGVQRLINSLAIAVRRVENVGRRMKLWGLETADVESACTGINDVASALQVLVKDGWTPPARSSLKIEEGATVKIVKAQRDSYIDAFNVTDTDLESLEVVKVAAPDGKRMKIVVRVADSNVQFPVAKRHIAVVSAAS